MLWVRYLDIPPFGEDTSLTSMNGLFAVRFAFRGWNHLLKGNQGLKLGPALLRELVELDLAMMSG